MHQNIQMFDGLVYILLLLKIYYKLKNYIWSLQVFTKFMILYKF